MKQGQAFKYPIIAGWFITALAIILVAPLIVPEENRSNYFWYRVVWTEVLGLLFWGTAFFYILFSAAQKESVSRFGGIAPTISILTVVYAVLSFSVMVVHAFMSRSDTASHVHWIVQIVFFAVAALSVVFLSISRASATSGLGFNRAKAMTPNELHDLLVVQESSLRSPASQLLKANIKRLREALVYSLNESASLAELPDYERLSREIKAFCDSMSGLASIGEGQANQLESLNESVIALTTKTKLVSAKQVRR